MSVPVYFEYPVGTQTTSRRFPPDSTILIGGSLVTPFARRDLTIEVTNDFSPITIQTKASILGNFWEIVSLPDVVGEANVRIITYSALGQPDVTNIPIGIGTDPGPLPIPIDPMFKYLLLGFLGLLAVISVKTVIERKIK